MRNLDCKDIKALLSPLIDGAADDETRHSAERHLADCAACRGLIDEAEANDALVASELDALIRPLPAGFEETVLRNTVFLQSPRNAFSSWATWMGWVAAAAAFTLAATIFVMDQRLLTLRGIQDQARTGQHELTRPSEFITSHDGQRATMYSPNDLQRSFTYEGPLPSGTYASDSTTVLTVSPPQRRPTDRILVPEELMVAPPLTEMTPMRPAAPGPAMSVVSRDDSETLSSAALLMSMLSLSDLTSFADAEQIRQIAEYDELLQRLAETRNHLPEVDQQLVLVAESMLARIIVGPLAMEDLRVMQDAARRLDLARRLESISERWVPAETL